MNIEDLPTRPTIDRTSDWKAEKGEKEQIVQHLNKSKR